jgi:tRNA(fMet)-specific endonuclease VapC
LSGYLLDTNIVSALMNEPQGRAAQRAARAGHGNVFTSVIVAAELRFGALRKRSQRLSLALDGLFNELAVKPLEPFVAVQYGHMRVALELAGTPIGANDMFIAAHAMALDATLVSDNEREFSRVEGLRLENWLR